jgi:hypothetical protein
MRKISKKLSILLIAALAGFSSVQATDFAGKGEECAGRTCKYECDSGKFITECTYAWYDIFGFGGKCTSTCL